MKKSTLLELQSMVQSALEWNEDNINGKIKKDEMKANALHVWIDLDGIEELIQYELDKYKVK